MPEDAPTEDTAAVPAGMPFVLLFIASLIFWVGLLLLVLD